VYKLAAGKKRNNTLITTLRQPGGSLTEDLRETIQVMLEHFTPVDKEEDDTELHKQARAQALEPAVTDNFTISLSRKLGMQPQA